MENTFAVWVSTVYTGKSDWISAVVNYVPEL